MAFDWQILKKAEAAAATQKGKGNYFKPTDEWQCYYLDMKQGPREKEFMGRIQYNYRLLDGNWLVLTLFQTKILMEHLPDQIEDVWPVELKLGIGNLEDCKKFGDKFKGKPILRVRTK